MSTETRNLLKENIDYEFRIKCTEFGEVFDYMPPEFISGWNGKYASIKSGKDTYKRPDKTKSTFKSSLKKLNALDIGKHSIGIYLLYLEFSKSELLYVGQTTNKIEQRFHAHITKLTSTNNDQHDHPVKWQDFARERYRTLQEKSVLLDDAKIAYLDLKEFQKFLTSSREIDQIDEFEAMIYYFFRKFYQNMRFLNDESRVGKGVFRKQYKAFWNF